MKEEIKKKKQGVKRKVEEEARYYIDGNTVRKVAPKEPNRKEREVSKNNKKIRKNRVRANSMGLSYLVILSIAMIAIFVLCVNYISIQSRLDSTIRHTQAKEQELKNLRDENTAMENYIATYVDLNHIYDVATNKLGMIYAKKNQVITYEKTESEYVRQFENIPQ